MVLNQQSHDCGTPRKTYVNFYFKLLLHDCCKSIEVFLKACVMTSCICYGLWSFKNILLLMEKYSIFSGSISLTKSETKCPLAPCPSKTPYSTELFITNLGIHTYASWLTLGLLSNTPARLLAANLHTTDRSGSSRKNLSASKAFGTSMSWDLALRCICTFGLFLSDGSLGFILPFLSVSCEVRGGSKLVIFFLWPFFSGAEPGVLKILRFLISKLILILG